MKTKLILVRHGEARGNVDRLFHGFTNSDLTENGRCQIKRLAERLAKESIDHLYASDLKRAYETGCAIADPRDMQVEIDLRFREINGGDWENVRWDDLPRLFSESYRDWLDRPHALQMPEGESMTAFYDRVRTGVEDIVSRHPGQTICIATHGTVIRVLGCYFREKPLAELNDIDWCDNASITAVSCEGNKFTILSDGDNTHLSGISTLEKQSWWKR